MEDSWAHLLNVSEDDDIFANISETSKGADVGDSFLEPPVILTSTPNPSPRKKIRRKGKSSLPLPVAISCKQCSSTFKTKPAFLRHERIHRLAGEEIY